MKVFANQNGFHTKITGKDLLHKFLGREAREFQCERHDYRGFDAERIEPLHALRDGGESQRRGLWPQHFPWGGIKREHRGDRIEGLRTLDRGAKNRLMAEMDTVEVTD